MTRIDLSAHTHIEDMDGVRYLVATRPPIVAEWEGFAAEYRNAASVNWLLSHGEDVHESPGREWRIPLTAVAPVYAYIEGEQWAGFVRGMLICGSSVAYTGNAEALFHRRVTNVCDSTKQFRQFFHALKEARDQ